ncbi:hypothetical protein G4V62_11255 [Bacillaceae bacterium SIJ1]|uniref:hypothetical protein n=1 Tax=Litoribacterium kuwaitense TaxID=1398745 RepID=UPI0013EAFE57|nr:hypothetical protein [Litoribacterium kuwaitense]NGP45506.1 hypothetical protein [Litoribacterium kuwaitense]
MKSKSIFPGCLLFSLGLYFLSGSLSLSWLAALHTIPMLLVFIGASFLAGAIFGGEALYFLPGTLLTGTGLYFMVGTLWLSPTLALWVLFLLTGAAFFVFYVQTRKGLLMALLFTASGLFLQWAPLSWAPSLSFKYWPLLLSIVGLYLLLKQK